MVSYMDCGFDMPVLPKTTPYKKDKEDEHLKAILDIKFGIGTYDLLLEKTKQTNVGE